MLMEESSAKLSLSLSLHRWIVFFFFSPPQSFLSDGRTQSDHGWRLLLNTSGGAGPSSGTTRVRVRHGD